MKNSKKRNLSGLMTVSTIHLTGLTGNIAKQKKRKWLYGFYINDSREHMVTMLRKINWLITEEHRNDAADNASKSPYREYKL